MSVALDLEGPQSRADLEAIARLPGLSTLDLDGATFDPTDLVVLAASPTLSHVWVDKRVPQAALDAFVAAPGRSRTCRSFW